MTHPHTVPSFNPFCNSHTSIHTETLSCRSSYAGTATQSPTWIHSESRFPLCKFQTSKLTTYCSLVKKLPPCKVLWIMQPCSVHMIRVRLLFLWLFSSNKQTVALVCTTWGKGKKERDKIPGRQTSGWELSHGWNCILHTGRPKNGWCDW